MNRKTLSVLIIPALIWCMGCSEKPGGIQLLKISYESTSSEKADTTSWGSVQNFSAGPLIKYLPDQNGVIALPATGGDILYIDAQGQHERSVCFVYRPEDGADLVIQFDGPVTRLNDRPFALHLHALAEDTINDPEMSDQDIKDLQYIDFQSASRSIEVRSFIDHLAVNNPTVGMIAEDSITLLALEKLDPEFLMVSANYVNREEITRRILNEKGITSLVMVGFTAGDLNMVVGLPQLTRLVATEVDAEWNASGMKLPVTLRSLTLSFGNGLVDLIIPAEDEGTPLLESYSLLSLDSTPDLSLLENFGNLRSLDLALCDAAGKLDALSGLESLESMSFPVETSQEAFNGFLARHPHLKFVSIADCDSIQDLSPLLGLDELDYLIANPGISELSAGSFRGLEGLTYLSLQFDDESVDSTFINDIAMVLPETVINRSTGGLCLGSGYLLLILPLTLTFIVLRSLRRKRTS